jgi:lipid-A-disaccharide synthase
MGGDHCRAAGLECLEDAHDVSVMGITEVIPAIPRILGVLSRLAKAAKDRQPDLAVLIDIPDFNLRLAKRLHQAGIPVVYYVSPTVWAWRQGRVKTIRKYIRRMICIFPFEVEFYRARGVDAVYVGNPTIDELDAASRMPTTALAPRSGSPVLALLPGSRRSEVKRILPAMLASAADLRRDHPQLEILIPVAPTIPESMILELAESSGLTPTLVKGQAPAVVRASDAAIVASGTAVLEAALQERPLVVVYRVSTITYWVARLMVKVAHVAIVNLLAGKRIVPELLQGDMQPARIAFEIRRLLDDRAAREAMMTELAAVRRTLGGPGAAERAAAEVLSLVPATLQDSVVSIRPKAG